MSDPSSVVVDRIKVLSHLRETFGGTLNEPDVVHFALGCLATRAAATTIGVEVEVRFSSYFWELFYDFKLDEQPYAALSTSEQAKFLTKLGPLEQPLLAKLNQAIECGVPKGKDRYWEFAHSPVYHPDLLADEIDLLRQADLVPYNQNHSLHITIGGLPMGKDAGILLMILELLGYTSKERILSGVNPKKATMWSRKGRAGMRERKVDLEYGTTVATELRTLELPPTHQATQSLLYVAWLLAESLRRPDLRHIWDTILAAALPLVEHLDISSNWGPGYENVDKWTQFADTISRVNNRNLWNTVKRVVKESIIDDPAMKTPANVYLRPSNIFSTIIY